MCEVWTTRNLPIRSRSMGVLRSWWHHPSHYQEEYSQRFHPDFPRIHQPSTNCRAWHPGDFHLFHPIEICSYFLFFSFPSPHRTRYLQAIPAHLHLLVSTSPGMAEAASLFI